MLRANARQTQTAAIAPLRTANCRQAGIQCRTIRRPERLSANESEVPGYETKCDSIVPGCRGCGTPFFFSNDWRRADRFARSAQGAAAALGPAVRVRLRRSSQRGYGPL